MSCNCEKTSSVNETEIVDLNVVRKLIESYDPQESNLITLLQGVQEGYGYLPEASIQLIANELDIKEAKIYGVATFYSQFRLKPIGENLILLCQGTACHVNGSWKIENEIKKLLNVEEGETTEDGKFTFINVACLGCCSLAPVMMINDQTFGNLEIKDIKKIIEEVK